jgi:2-haloacid dehalogenase
VVFDLGGVLVDWSPRRLMEKVIADPDRCDHFLDHVLTSSFLLALDISRDSRQAIVPLMRANPEYAVEMAAYVERFPETIGGEFADMAALTRRLHEAGVALYGLTNWAGDTFASTRPTVPCLQFLRDIVVSGDEGIVKPDPRIFELLCRRGGFSAADAVFIDDSERNAAGARTFGMAAIHHRSADQTMAELRVLGFPA